MKFKRPESILIVVHTLDWQFLLLKRNPPVSFWQSVTGSLKDSEQPVDAAIRELQEETGITAGHDALRDWHQTFQFEILKEYQNQYKPGVIYNTEHVFSFSLPGPVDIALNEQEHSDSRWEDFETAQALIWSWSNQKALELVHTSF